MLSLGARRLESRVLEKTRSSIPRAKRAEPFFNSDDFTFVSLVPKAERSFSPCC